MTEAANRHHCQLVFSCSDSSEPNLRSPPEHLAPAFYSWALYSPTKSTLFPIIHNYKLHCRPSNWLIFHFCIIFLWCGKKKFSQILSGRAVFGLCRFLPDGARYQGPIRERRRSSPSLPVTLIPVEHNFISYQHCFVSRPPPPPPPTHQTLLVFSSLLIIKTFSNLPPFPFKSFSPW